MPDKDKTVEANGKTFTFPANTPNEEISQAVDDYFSSNPTTEPLKKKEPSIASPLLSNSTDGVSESTSDLNPNRFNFLTGQNDIAPEPVKAPLETPIPQDNTLRAATTPLETTAKDITNFDQNIAQKQEELNPKKEALARGVAKMGSLLLQSPTFAYDAAVSTTNYLLNKPLGLPDAPTWKQLSDTDESLYKTAISDLEDAVNRSSQEKAKRYDKEINQYFFGDKKDLSKGFDLLSENIIESIPSSIGLAFAASQNPTAAAALGTAAFGADNKRQLDEAVPDMPEDQKVMWSSLMGGTEMAMESLGITKLGPMFKDVLKKSGKEAVDLASKELFDKSVGKILKQYLGVQAEEVSSEMANTFLQNIYAKASGLDENRKPMDGVWDSGLTAFGQGAGMTAPTAALDIVVTKAARKKASDIQDQKATLQQDLQSPDVSDEAKQAISAKLRTVNEQEADLVTEEKSKLESLSPDQKTEVDLLNQQANKIATAATDENISEQTKEILKQDLDEVDKKVEKIFSEPKGAEVAAQAQDIADEIDYLNEVKNTYGLTPEEQARMDELNPPEKLGEPQVEPATETGLVEGEQKAEPIELNPNIETANDNKTGLILYHGSPHSFENFDISKLGSGEGAQAFGHGLYFTNESDIAKGYANKLSSKKNFWEALENGHDLSLSKEDYNFIKKELDALGFDGSRAENSDLGNILVDGKNEHSPEVLDAMSVLFGKDAKKELEGYDLSENEINRLLEIKKKISDPQFYKVAIHEGKSPSEYDYIEWRDKLTDSQRKKIGEELPENISGEDAYKTLSKKLGGDKKTSEYLLSKGIDGISYKSNNGTGGKTGDGRNYVVFDQKSIRIDEINNKKQEDGAGSVGVGGDVGSKLEKPYKTVNDGSGKMVKVVVTTTEKNGVKTTKFKTQTTNKQGESREQNDKGFNTFEEAVENLGIDLKSEENESALELIQAVKESQGKENIPVRVTEIREGTDKSSPFYGKKVATLVVGGEKVDVILEQSLKETTKAEKETVTETIQEKGIEEAGSVGGDVKLEGYHYTDKDFTEFEQPTETQSLGNGTYFYLNKRKSTKREVTSELNVKKVLDWKELKDEERDTIIKELEKSKIPIDRLNDGKLVRKAFSNIDEAKKFSSDKRAEGLNVKTDLVDGEYIVEYKEKGVSNASNDKLRQLAAEFDPNIAKRLGYDAAKLGDEIVVFDIKNTKIKPTEQSLKETTKAETPTTNTGVEEGSGGVGGDVEATTKALDDIGRTQTVEGDIIDKILLQKSKDLREEDGTVSDKNLKEFKDVVSARASINAAIAIRPKAQGSKERYVLSNKEISEAYHKAKKDGTNPELVKAVEQSLKETTKAETTTPKGNTSNEEKRGDALERIGVDRQAPDGLQRKEWKEARDYDLGRAISIVENQLNANPNSKIGSIPMNAANAIRAELEMVGVKTTDKTPLSEIIDKIKAVEQSLKETTKAETTENPALKDVEGFVGGTKIYRAGGKGRYFTTDKQYIQEGGFKGETREFEIPGNTKLLDLREEDYKGILDLATEEERSILRKPQAKNSIEAKEQGNIVDAILKRNGYDGYIIKDAGETKDFDTVVFRKDKSPDLKAVEQSLKETTVQETPIEEKSKPKVEKPADTTSLKEEDDLLETEKADDKAVVDKFNLDLDQMKKSKDNDNVDKKFMGILERSYKAKVDGKISEETYESQKKKIRDVLEKKHQLYGKKVDYIEAKAKSNELFNKVKEKLIGQDYKKITLSSTIPITPQNISDLIDLTNNLVNRGIEVYENIDIALEKALATIKKNPAYKRLIASGELKEADFDKAIKEANKEIKKEETPEPKEEPAPEQKEPVKEKTESKEKPTSKEAGIDGEKRERATNERIYDSSRFKDASKLVDKKLDEYDSVSQEKAIEYINTKLDEFESEGLLHDLALELNKPEGEKVFPESISLVAPVLLADRLSAMAERETNPLYKDTLNKLSAKTLDTWRQRTTSIAQQLGLTSFIAKYMPKSKAGIKAKIERELSEAQDTYFDSKEKKQIEGLQKEVANQSDPNFAEKINKLVMDEVNRIGKALKGNEWVKKTNEALDEIMDDLKDC